MAVRGWSGAEDAGVAGGAVAAGDSGTMVGGESHFRNSLSIFAMMKFATPKMRQSEPVT
jgi:hypothetical protein